MSLSKAVSLCLALSPHGPPASSSTAEETGLAEATQPAGCGQDSSRATSNLDPGSDLLSLPRRWDHEVKARLALGSASPATRGLGAWRDGDQISLVRAALGPRGGDRPAASCLSPSASILFRVRFPRNSSLERTCSSFASLENLVFVTLFARILSYVSE